MYAAARRTASLFWVSCALCVLASWIFPFVDGAGPDGYLCNGQDSLPELPGPSLACLALPPSCPEHLHAICWLPAVKLPTCADCMQRPFERPSTLSNVSEPARRSQIHGASRRVELERLAALCVKWSLPFSYAHRAAGAAASRIRLGQASGRSQRSRSS